MWPLITLLVASSASAFFHQPTHETHHYYVLHHDASYASLADVAGLLGLQIVEPIGELQDFWLARTEANRTLAARAGGHPDSVMDTYWNLRRRSLSSRSAPEDDPNAVAKRLGIKDPYFNKQWSIVNEEDPKNSLNVVPVWDLGYTGRGVITAIVDDGLFFDHKDIKANFVEEYSYDFLEKDTLKSVSSNRHGTGVAGVIASLKNDLCGVGIAYNSKVAGVRILGKDGIFPSDIARAFNHKYEDVPIYTCSFGPGINKSPNVAGPAYVTRQALLNAVNKGRKTKGNIFVFAAGNGGNWGNDCNYNGYVNSIYTIAIGALDHKNKHPSYSDSCVSLMAVAYSHTKTHHHLPTLGITASDSCSDSDFGFTSAASASAAAIFALALEARPELTWRDMQHLCVETARPIIKDEKFKLASNKYFSPQFGFGALDAYEFVTKAKSWPLVKPQVWIMPPPIQFEKGTMDEDKDIGSFGITKDMVDEQDFNKIEHVQIRVWVGHKRRGDIKVTLTSPRGIVSEIPRRLLDSAATGLFGWTFSSLKHWGEEPAGIWKVVVSDDSTRTGRSGELIGLSVIFWGNAKGTRKDYELYEMPEDDYDIFPPEEWLTGKKSQILNPR